MHRTIGLAAGLLVAFLLAVGPVAAGPPYTGTTTFVYPNSPPDPTVPTSGFTQWVDVSVTTDTPVVAYEYAINNKCSWSHKGSSSQTDVIVNWTYELDGLPHAVLPIYLQSVPSGASCTVFLTRSNVVVKGTALTYTVN